MHKHETLTQQEHIVSDYYTDHREIQAEIFASEKRKTRNALLTVAALLLASDLLSLFIANAVTAVSLLSILVIPVLFAAIALFAQKRPVVAAVAAILLYVGLWVVSIYAFGGQMIISGLIIKAITIYFLLAAFTSAREAERARKNGITAV